MAIVIIPTSSGDTHAMRPEQIELIEDGFAVVASDADGFTRRFYTNLFTTAPSVRALFPDDLGEQRQKLVRELVVIIDGVTDPDRLLPRLRKLGARHVGYGAEAAHYGVVGSVLIETLAEVLGEGFTANAREAWTAAIGVIATAMLEGAEECAPLTPA